MCIRDRPHLVEAVAQVLLRAAEGFDKTTLIEVGAPGALVVDLAPEEQLRPPVLISLGDLAVGEEVGDGAGEMDRVDRAGGQLDELAGIDALLLHERQHPHSPAGIRMGGLDVSERGAAVSYTHLTLP